MTRDRGSDAFTGFTHELHGLAGGNVLEYDAQRGEFIHQTAERAIDERPFAIEYGRMLTEKGIRVSVYEEIGCSVAAIDEEIWPTNPTRPKQRDPSAGDTFSEFTMSGKEPMTDLVNQIYSDFNKKNGTDIHVPEK